MLLYYDWWLVWQRKLHLLFNTFEKHVLTPLRHPWPWSFQCDLAHTISSARINCKFCMDLGSIEIRSQLCVDICILQAILILQGLSIIYHTKCHGPPFSSDDCISRSWRLIKLEKRFLLSKLFSQSVWVEAMSSHQCWLLSQDNFPLHLDHKSTEE